MKRLTVFILLLLSSNQGMFACIDYPDGDHVRFSLFNPKYFGFEDYSLFFYSPHYFFIDESDTSTVKKMNGGEKMNCDLWRKRCKNIPSEISVYDGVYSWGDNSQNPFVKYLFAKKDTEAIFYLNFARECTGLDNLLSDPWERNQEAYFKQRLFNTRSAITHARDTRDDDIRLRYAFQAIRMAYYGSNASDLIAAYDEFFSKRKKRNIIDYWAMYFRALVESDGALKNYYLAQVFKNAPDKRFMCCQEYDKSVPLIHVLRLAKSSKEKAAVWLLSSVHSPGRKIESIKSIAELDPNSEGLSFMLTREINKLEDWIYTPYYSNFEPSVEFENHPYYDEVSYSRMQSRINKDRMYAQQLLEFVNLKKPIVKTRPLFWGITRAYLLFMTQDYTSALEQIHVLENDKNKSQEINDELEMINALCLTASQPTDSAIILDEVKPILMHEYSLSNQKFILAIAKELEYKNDKTDAALLLSKLNPSSYDWMNLIQWKDKRKGTSISSDYYTDYFSYLDDEYTPYQMKKLIAAVEKSSQQADTFSVWKFSDIKNQVPRLYDLLGTKYMRENELALALSNFEKVNDTLWTSKNEPFYTYLDANPFYTNLYNEHTRTDADTVRYNKESLTRTLIDYLSKAEDATNKNRDYYCFLVANCYLNMTQYGNSWIMKRYWWGYYSEGADLPDKRDYCQCDNAKKYYLKAQLFAKNKKFAALCLRMAGRCENYRLIYVMNEGDSYYERGSNAPKAFRKNIYYKQIKKNYPAYYDDLISNCYSFEEYFRARR